MEDQIEIVFPEYYAILEKTKDGWGFCPSTKFYPYLETAPPNPLQKFQMKCLERQLNWKAVLAEIKGRYCGKLGFYLVNLRDREYHYCGTELRDVKTFVQENKIGV